MLTRIANNEGPDLGLYCLCVCFSQVVCSKYFLSQNALNCIAKYPLWLFKFYVNIFSAKAVHMYMTSSDSY